MLRYMLLAGLVAGCGTPAEDEFDFRCPGYTGLTEVGATWTIQIDALGTGPSIEGTSTVVQLDEEAVIVAFEGDFYRPTFNATDVSGQFVYRCDEVGLWLLSAESFGQTGEGPISVVSTYNNGAGYLAWPLEMEDSWTVSYDQTIQTNDEPAQTISNWMVFDVGATSEIAVEAGTFEAVEVIGTGIDGESTGSSWYHVDAGRVMGPNMELTHWSG